MEKYQVYVDKPTSRIMFHHESCSHIKKNGGPTDEKHGCWTNIPLPMKEAIKFAECENPAYNWKPCAHCLKKYNNEDYTTIIQVCKAHGTGTVFVR